MKLRLGFVGGGVNSAVGYTHFVASQMDGFFEVAAGCFSRDAEKNKETGRLYGLSPDRVYSDLDEMLSVNSGLLDAICILTPTPNHAEMVIQCLNAGFHVICEKALATSKEECRAILEVQQLTKRFLGVTFNYAGYPMVREMRQMIVSGQLGDVQQVYCEMPQESFAREGASPQEWRKVDYEIPCVSLDLGVHVHHLATYTTGISEPSNTLVKTASFASVKNVVDTVALLSDFDADVLVSMMWGKAVLGPRNGLRIRIFCEGGSLEWNQSNPESLMFATKDGVLRVLDRACPDLLIANERRYNRFKAGHPAGFIEAFANLYADFHGALVAEEVPNDIAHFTGETAEKGIAFLQSLVPAAP